MHTISFPGGKSIRKGHRFGMLDLPFDSLCWCLTITYKRNLGSVIPFQLACWDDLRCSAALLAKITWITLFFVITIRYPMIWWSKALVIQFSGSHSEVQLGREFAASLHAAKMEHRNQSVKIYVNASCDFIENMVAENKVSALIISHTFWNFNISLHTVRTTVLIISFQCVTKVRGQEIHFNCLKFSDPHSSHKDDLDGLQI
jgi:hypothetical protein